MKKFKLIAIIMAAVIVSGCTNAAEEEAKEKAKDVDTSILASCSTDDVSKVSISTVSWTDTSAICEKMAMRIGSNPSVQSLRELSRAVATMEINGGPKDIIDNAYQFMRVVESRGQLHNDPAMINTFNITFKINSGTEGRVAPKDLNILLSNMGDGAEKLSDDGVYNLAALTSVQKQDAGQ